MASEAAMALSVVGVTAPLACPSLSLSVMVEVDGDRAKALKGPRWVSFNFLVSFHDMIATDAVFARDQMRPIDEAGSRIQEIANEDLSDGQCCSLTNS